jgi:hypothetical protein
VADPAGEERPGISFLQVRNNIYFPLSTGPHDELKWYGTPVPIISTTRIRYMGFLLGHAL